MALLPWDAAGYAAWLERHGRLTGADRQAIAAQVARMGERPRFLLVPLLRAGESPADWAETLRGALSQLYPEWRLCLPGAAWLEGLPEPPPRPEQVLAVPLPAAAEALPAAFLQAALAAAEDDEAFVLPLPRGAVLDETALHEFALLRLRHPDSALLYADEDRLDAAGRRVSPRFKTGFDPELMLARDALGLPLAFRLPLLRGLGGLRREAGPLGVALHDLALRAMRRVPQEQIRHVPAVLCHRRLPEDAPAEWEGEAARRVVREHLAACGQPAARLRPVPQAPQWCAVDWPLPARPPLVSVIIPTRDGAGLLARSADAVLRRTDYPALELLVVDNGSTGAEALALLARLRQDPRVRVLDAPGPFNYAALNNAAAAAARGEVLLLLNNDTDVYEPGWLRAMVAQALRPEVGAVGAKLVYADGRLQHGGVVLSPGPMLAHQLRLAEPEETGPQGELILARSVLAVTGACLAIRRQLYLAMGGLDAGALRVAFNDIDLCLRLGSEGYRIVWTPEATLMHLESVSRGDDASDPERHARFLRELGVIQSRWAVELARDPYHNPNLLFSWQGSGLASPPRRSRPWLA